jgi:hypothetical protein
MLLGILCKFGWMTLNNIIPTILLWLCYWYGLGWNKLMPLIILVMKELFLAFEFQFQDYIPRDKMLRIQAQLVKFH